MLEGLLRPALQKHVLQGLAQKLAVLGVGPNFITLLAVISGIGCAGSIISGYPYWAIVLLWLSGYLDMLDGSVARLTQSTPVGTAFDIMADRVVESGVIVALFMVAPDNRGFACLGMMASVLICVTSFLVVGIFSDNQTNKSFHYSPGLMERAEAFIFFTLMILLPELFSPLAVLFIVLVSLTALIRLFEFQRAFR